MKKTAVLGLAAAACFVAGSALASNTDTASTTLEVIESLDLTHGDLVFGRVAHNDLPCDVTLTPDAFGNGTVGYPAAGECYVIPATFHDGDWSTQGDVDNGLTTYSITMLTIDATNDVTCALCVPSTTIPVDNWTVISDDVALTTFPGAGGDSGSVSGFVLDGPPFGADAFSIGGTAHLAGTEPAGVYTGSFTLQATYP